MNGNDIAVLLGMLAAAIALAGFASIVTSIDRSAAGVSSAVISFRVRRLVIGAITVVILAMLPILLDALELAKSMLWQVSSLIGAFTTAAFLITTILARRRLTGSQQQGFSNLLFVTNMGLGSLSVAIQIAGVVRVVPARGAYLSAVFFLLYFTGTLFHRMIHMVDVSASNRGT